MKYKAVLLDADDTVADFHTAEEKALKILFDRLGFTMEEAADDYKRINKACWAAYEKGAVLQQLPLSGMASMITNVARYQGRR